MGTYIGTNLNKDWFKVYDWTTWDDVSTFTYDFDASGTAPSFTRILYLLRIDDYSVWIELDDFTSNTANRVGIPLTWTYDVAVTNMVVKYRRGDFPDADLSTIYNRVNSGVDGKLNFWPSNYSQSPTSNYDENDSGFSASNGHGSFQFFDVSASPAECIFAWNHWGVTTPTFGMGSRGTSHKDWTFAYNANNFTTISGKIYVK